MPPAIRIFILFFEFSESDDSILEVLAAKRRTLEISIVDVHLIVKLRIVQIRNHGKEHLLVLTLLICTCIIHLEPELDSVLLRPFLKRWRLETDIALAAR